MSNERTNFVIYHGRCPDGTASAWVARLALGDAPTAYYGALHGDPPPDVTNCNVFILDFAYPRDVLLQMKEKAHSLVVIDHHKTAQANLEGLDFCIFNMEHSGAVLTWKYFFKDAEVPLFLLYVEDRDLFKNQLVDTEQVAAARYSYPMDFASLDLLVHPFEPDKQVEVIEQLRADGVPLLRSNRQKASEMADNYRFLEVGGHVVPVVNASSSGPDVVVELYRRFPGYPFAAYYFDRADGLRQWGLFNPNDHPFDVSAVAKQYGGGGHAHAAGFEQVAEDNPLLIHELCSGCGAKLAELEAEEMQAG